jgi:signal transduction histidine kinase/ABC-type amino acid transport substrate-binding protein
MSTQVRRTGELLRAFTPANWAVWVGTLWVVLSLVACGKSGTKDLLSPDERQWLMSNQQRIVLAVETGYAPFVFLDAGGQPTGLAHDHLLLLESKLGVHFQRRNVSTLDEIFGKVRSGEIQVVNAIAQTPWRSEFISFTKPFVSVPNVIVVRKERSGPMGEEQLRGLRVSLVRSYAVTERLTRRGLGFEAALVPDDLTGLLDVAFGRSDAVVTDLATASFLIQKKGITNLRVAGEAGFEIHLSMGTPRNEPRLFSILQKGLESITEAERRGLRKRWINASDPSILADWRFWLAGGGVLCLVMMVIAAILVWNRTLQRQVALRTRALAEEKESLRVSEAQNRALISAIPDLIFTNRRDGEFLAVHASDPSLLFAPPATFLRRRVGEVLPGVIADQFMAAYAKALDSDAVQHLDYALPMGGQERHFEARIVPCTEDTVISIVRDVTERTRAEDENAKLQAQLQQAQKMDSLGSLAGGVAHDMNNVLGAILGMASANIEAQPVGSPAYRAFDTIIQAAARGGKMVRSLLSFARQSPVDEQELDMNAILREEVSLLERTTLAKVRLEMDLAPDLRPVRGDASALTHALMNLCVNAVDAMPDDGTLTLRTRNVDEGWIEITVEDTGSGMPKEVLEKALDPFFTTKGVGKGAQASAFPWSIAR